MNISFSRCLGIELKRAFCEKQVRLLVLISFVYWLVRTMLEMLCSLSMYYYGMPAGEPMINFGSTPCVEAVLVMVSNSVLIVYYLPLLAALVYAHSIVEERRSGYAVQICQKTGFGTYCACKLAASGLLGGFISAVQEVIVMLIAFFVEYNPLISDAVAYYKQFEVENSYDNIVYGEYVLGEVSGVWMDCIFVMGCFFVAGMMYGLLAGLVAFVSDNKLLVWVAPLLFSSIWESLLYVIFLPWDGQPGLLGKLDWWLSIKYTSPTSLEKWNMMLAVSLCFVVIALCSVKKLRLRYMEGGR